jgi:hypothetical protein
MQTTGRRVYFFVETKWGVDNIRRERLKVCRFFDLNDPFELIAADQRDKALRKKLKEWAKKLNEAEGLLCFTRSWQNPLMWSHYGDRHRGICLGFDVGEHILKPINYEPERLSLGRWSEAGFADLPTDLRYALLTTKFERWAYEEERRVILPLRDLLQEGPLFFKRFDDDLKLVEVIAGARCCVGWKRPIEDAVESLPIRPRLVRLGLRLSGSRS